MTADKQTASRKVVSKNSPAIGVDLGGTKIRAGAVADGLLISPTRQVETPDTPAEILSAIEDMVEQFREEFAKISGVGIATAGIVDCQSGQVIGSTGNLPGWAGTRLKEEMEKRLEMPVHVDNDANAAAFGEAQSQELISKRCIITVTLGTGIGGGIVLNGELYHGAHWAAGEIGHLKLVDENGRPCTCGNSGCWEAYGCGSGLETTAREMVAASKEESLLSRDEITTYRIFEAQSQNDALAERIVSKWHEHVAHGLSILAQILNPDCIVIAGGLSSFSDTQALTRLTVARTLDRVGEVLEIRHSALSGNAGLIGAAMLTASRSKPAPIL